jgi:hypothetical protein
VNRNYFGIGAGFSAAVMGDEVKPGADLEATQQ